MLRRRFTATTRSTSGCGCTGDGLAGSSCSAGCWRSSLASGFEVGNASGGEFRVTGATQVGARLARAVFAAAGFARLRFFDVVAERLLRVGLPAGLRAF